jgi:hypothetical protein
MLVVLGLEGAVAAAPYTTGRYGEAAVQGGHGVVAAQRLIRTGVRGWCRRDGPRSLDRSPRCSCHCRCWSRSGSPVPAVRSAALVCRSHSAWCCSVRSVPAPPLHVPPVAPVTTEPFKVIALLFAQTDAFAPAFTVGAGVKVITRSSDTALQLPLPVLRQGQA